MANLPPITTIHPSAAQVFKVEVPEARQHLRGTYSADKCSRNWKLTLPRQSWIDLSDPDEALAHVPRGSSLLVQGIAGTGKTHTIRQVLLPALEKQGKRVSIIAKTHVAAAVAGGATVDHFAWKHVRE
jgi:Cdc6-like AAA superfamily ATPase